MVMNQYNGMSFIVVVDVDQVDFFMPLFFPGWFQEICLFSSQKLRETIQFDPFDEQIGWLNY